MGAGIEHRATSPCLVGVDRLTSDYVRANPFPSRVADSRRVFYPETDSKPMAENTLQHARWIVLLIENIRNLFATIRMSLSRAICSGIRWRGGWISPWPRTVWSPWPAAREIAEAINNGKWKELGAPCGFRSALSQQHPREMMDKLRAYERYGVEEVYYYDPDRSRNCGRGFAKGEHLTPVAQVEGFVSSRPKIRFWPQADGMKIEGARMEPRLRLSTEIA